MATLAGLPIKEKEKVEKEKAKVKAKAKEDKGERGTDRRQRRTGQRKSWSVSNFRRQEHLKGQTTAFHVD